MPNFREAADERYIKEQPPEPMFPITDPDKLDEWNDRWLDHDIWHLDGVSWIDAPVPSKLHSCWTQTRGWTGITFVRRCACGGISINGEMWLRRNERRIADRPSTLIGWFRR